jgi:hypothetical protein
MASEGKSGRVDNKAAAPKSKASGRARNTARHHSPLHLDSEQRARYLLMGGVIAVLLIAAAFVGFGYWYSVVKPRNRTVLQVDDIKVSYSAMKRRMGYEFFQNTRYQSQQGAQSLPLGAYQALVDELTEISRAENSLGVTVDQSEFDSKLRARVGVADGADQRSFADGLRTQLQTTGLHEDEYRRLIRAQLIDQKIIDKYRSELPASMTQAKVQVISNQDQTKVQEAINRINAGEDMGDVAKDTSQDADASTGGIKEYAPQGTLNAAYDGYAYTADVGSLSGVLTGGNSKTTLYYVVKLLDRSDQPVTDQEKPTLANNKKQEWLTNTEEQMSSEGKLVNDFDNQAQSDAFVSVLNDVAPRLAQQRADKTAQALQADSVRKTTIANLTASPQATRTPDPNATPTVETTPAAGDTPPAGSTPPAASGADITPPAPNNGQ